MAFNSAGVEVVRRNPRPRLLNSLHWTRTEVPSVSAVFSVGLWYNPGPFACQNSITPHSLLHDVDPGSHGEREAFPWSVPVGAVLHVFAGVLILLMIQDACMAEMYTGPESCVSN